MGSERINIYEGNKPFVFISYSSKDRDWVRPKLEQLSNLKVRLWYDNGTLGGEDWNTTIEAHIKNCALIILFATPNSLSSPFVKRELSIGHDTLGKPVLPIFNKKDGYRRLLPNGMLWLDTLQCRFLDTTDLSKIAKKDIPSSCKGDGAPSPAPSSPIPSSPSSHAPSESSSSIRVVSAKVDNFVMPPIMEEYKSELKENIRNNRVHKAYEDAQVYLNNIFPLFLRLCDFNGSLRNKVNDYLGPNTFYIKGCEIVIRDVLSNHGLYAYFSSINEKANKIKHPDGSPHSLMNLGEFCGRYNDFLDALDKFLSHKTSKEVNIFRNLKVNYKKVMKGAGAPPNPKPTEPPKPNPVPPTPKKNDKKSKIREWDIDFSIVEKSRTAVVTGFLRKSIKVTLNIHIGNPHNYPLKEVEITAYYGDDSMKRLYYADSENTEAVYEVSWPKKENIRKIKFSAVVKYKIRAFKWAPKEATTTVTF